MSAARGKKRPRGKGTPVRYWGLSTCGQEASIVGVAFTKDGKGRQVIDDHIPEMGDYNAVKGGRQEGTRAEEASRKKARPAFTVPAGGHAIVLVKGFPDNFIIHVGDVYVDIRFAR